MTLRESRWRGRIAEPSHSNPELRDMRIPTSPRSRKSSPRPPLRAFDAGLPVRRLAPVGPAATGATLAAAAALVLAGVVAGCSKSSASQVTETANPESRASAASPSAAASDFASPKRDQPMVAGTSVPMQPDPAPPTSASASATPASSSSAASTAKPFATPIANPPRPPGGMQPNRNDPLNPM